MGRVLFQAHLLKKGKEKLMLRRRLLLSSGVTSPAAPELRRAFRSEASLEAIRSHTQPSKDTADSDGPAAHLALYNYPTFAGAYAALAAHLFHRRLHRRLLVLPFSSVHPFRAEDFESAGFQTCYLLDFIGPNNFALELSRFIPSVIAFDHRQSTLARIPRLGHCPSNLELNIDTTRSSAQATFGYFSKKLAGTKSDSVSWEYFIFQFIIWCRLSNKKVSFAQYICENLLEQEDEERVFNILKYIEDADLRQWKLPNAKEFQTALRDERAKLNCITNPLVFEQLLQLDVCNLLSRSKLLAHDRLEAAVKLIHKPFKIQLGRGSYGECLAIRADGNSKLSHEISLELSQRSAAAGLRPIGAVVFMQRGLLKVCLRTMDNTINTAEIAKAHGGGGRHSSSSFVLRMDEFNAWTSVNS
uniref:DHHA1 domain-containing protein n=1 Tax=Oryza brachyantha TaxID=4533 RepID=J3LCN4_ORYBR